MAEKKVPSAAKPDEPGSAHHESVIPGYWGADMLSYGDISRLLFRMHRNVDAHMEAHKRLLERLQSVFEHENAMVMELAKIIDESIAQASRKSNEERPPVGKEGLDRVFEHAGKAMQETGKMLTDIQLEALEILKRYTESGWEGAEKSEEAADKSPDKSPGKSKEP